MGLTAVRHALGVLADGALLSSAEAASAVGQIIDGEASEVEIAALLGLLTARAETVDVLAGAVHAVRRRMLAFDVPDRLRPLLDTCGTGGDGAGSVNISSAVALVAAACGVRVAKHGNRSASGRSGSAEVFARLGVNVDADTSVALRCLEDVGITFLYAPRFHPALKHAAAVRKQLPFRTLFNLVGPLANPARAEVQLIGVPDEHRADLVAETLARLETGPQGHWPRTAAVVSSGDGLDEISLGSYSYLHRVHAGNASTVTLLEPESFGLAAVPAAALAVADAEDSAQAILAMLQGEPGPVREVVLANAAVALWLAGRSSDLKSGVELAREAVDSREALRRLDRWSTLCNEPAA
jgi:anthranilate phosphoribosyltransferase